MRTHMIMMFIKGKGGIVVVAVVGFVCVSLALCGCAMLVRL